MVGLILALFFIFITGLVWFFGFSQSSPIGAGWFLFSFAAGLSMIVLPCTLPLAFVIVPLSMGKGVKKGLFIALAFGLGVSITLSLYGLITAALGEFAIGTLDAPLETVKNWLYFIAGIFTYLFALGELGLINFRMPTYSGAHPGFIQRQGDILKALLLGLFLGNIGVGCPHPATPLILTRIAISGDVFYGWLLFFVHALGRITPLLILAILGILGVNALSWVISRRERIEKATGWAMVFVAGFILVLGLFSHGWWTYSGSHSLLESVTQEERFLGVISSRLDTAPPHQHGLEEFDGKTGLFGLPLYAGNWVLFLLWVTPLFWYWFKFGGAQPRERRALQLWFFVALSLLLGITFLYTIPHWFLKHKALEAVERPSVLADIKNLDAPKQKVPINFEIRIQPSSGAKPDEAAYEYSHERLMHVVAIHENLDAFLHFHPEDQMVITRDMLSGGVFPFAITFPKAGRYILAVDFKYKGEEISFHKTFDVGERKAGALKKDFARKGKFDGLNVELKIERENIRSGEEVGFAYKLFRNGSPVNDLELYLGAPAHFAIVSADLSIFNHTHGALSAEEGEHQGWIIVPQAIAHEGEEEDSRAASASALPEKFGPDVFLNYAFPYPGIYAIFGEFKRGGQVILTKFMVEVGVGGGSNSQMPGVH
ncbi:MAG: Cytochrome c biogenesis protein transmembrane region [Candidatus Giovannonibacteria bacterium GW2011_GWB1_46_20]|uniref:Cytochrome c biogenesis protein transmembrane region n=1 Tax=Candidatus Giovannonibacteria bacterium GW2011_GWA1_44_25 TaxID=1618645 RepID=A0A0G1IIK0_9BACT|nr:MAG: hypothetical protein UW15_C0025G0003 [Parcubacteria group bacterium GW2011_GWC1_44_10]KKT59186.1 MAG: Cytochrome c biogenesis protein transmembrane region [Candidatus Giovannonibacteria bacterium GW2011_GWA1_44_25]KKU29910.1 MAG: Cytochrome c biogenesis protein transmembrane region [Candidatus Giovannonibacteria bacterium GW2011_GWB1_46_20]